tara:strand:+ start:2138 stop:3838 length:1701 start_codon:yes stop_codon:yes gene_type:complete
MDNKNVFLAIVLSMAVLLFWQYAFIDPAKEVNNKNVTQIDKTKNKKVETSNSITPNINQNNKIISLSRNESINNSQRVKIENKNIKGSISLKGAVMDDLSFKNYRRDIAKDAIVNFLSPRETKDGYFIETGWTSVGNIINVPTSDSVWKITGNNNLSAKESLILEWKNGNGITFRKKVELDDKFLFKVTQEVINETSQAINLYPYAQITRNKIPDDLQNFYISHEGFISVFDEELKEDDYDDVEEKKISREASDGWFGITDKYWMTAVVPPKNQDFKSTFLYKDGFKANYILNNPITIKRSSKEKNEIKIFAAAKEVETIDNYAADYKIDKFDLVIDWGWFYFFTKPLFFVIDYLFKFSGNFGIAIVLITLAIRILFFPLANYSFKSMAKMKALQPEMVRLKDLHKDDKVKLQQEMMALYKKEQVNPASGCLPVLIQIPFFFAIYKMLFISLEMRHQPFFGWIKDLSAQDPTSLFNLFGFIPWDPPSFLIIGVWPILMGLSMWVQQKLNPAPTDPIQAKIFQFFPIFLTIILASFPSGLVVYWTVNNILTIAQQFVIMKRTKIKTN